MELNLDLIFRFITQIFTCFVLLILIAILIFLVMGSLPAIKAFGLHFIVSTDWNPISKQFGGLPTIVGTLTTSIIALLIGVPVSFGIALFLTELSPTWLKHPLRIAMELLAGIPSIIYGMWGLFVFAPAFGSYVQPWLSQHLGKLPILGVFFQGPPLGIGVLTAGIILSIMIIPFMAAVMRDVFAIVPDMIKESAYALGATTWEVVRSIVLPYAKIGVMGSIMLGLGRAFGETMAVAFVVGNTHILSASLLMPGNTIASALANEFTEANGELYSASLIELGLVLFLITSTLLFFSKLLLKKLAKYEAK